MHKLPVKDENNLTLLADTCLYNPARHLRFIQHSLFTVRCLQLLKSTNSCMRMFDQQFRPNQFKPSFFISECGSLPSVLNFIKPISAMFWAVVRFSCMVAFLTDIRLVFRSSLGNQQIHCECCQFQSGIFITWLFLFSRKL